MKATGCCGDTVCDVQSLVVKDVVAAPLLSRWDNSAVCGEDAQGSMWEEGRPPTLTQHSFAGHVSSLPCEDPLASFSLQVTQHGPTLTQTEPSLS